MTKMLIKLAMVHFLSLSFVNLISSNNILKHNRGERDLEANQYSEHGAVA